MRDDDRELGLDAEITRRDFLNAALIGSGAALLTYQAPGLAGFLPGGVVEAANDIWTGFGGTGDYAASNGNTRPVLDAAHKVARDTYKTLPRTTIDTGELYDVVIVGGGISGLTAAYTVLKEGGGSKRVLVLDNHAIFGGAAKQNEFLVNGQRLVGPQASNDFGVPRAGSNSLSDQVWTDFGLPREFKFQDVDPALGGLRIPLDNYANLDGVNEQQVDVGYFFDEKSGGAAKPIWVNNIWKDDLARVPWPDDVKRDLMRWRNTNGETAEAFRRSLDTMTYAQYLEGVMKLRPEVTSFVAPIVGLINGAAPDGVSAFAASQIGMPGVSRVRSRTGPLPMSFPGGNGAFPRHFVKFLIPDAISGAPGLEGVENGRVNFAALDRKDQPTRIRLGATVVRVEHAKSAAAGDLVSVAYELGGKVYRVMGRAAIMSSGGMMTRKVLADLPPEMAAAYSEFLHAPALVVNVALTNWRFLATLGISSARWFDNDFGFSCNIRRPMAIGGAPAAPMNPDRPTVLTFYMGLPFAGKPLAEQASSGRQLLLSRSYADYERVIRRHMQRLFGSAGLDLRKDIAGIVLNRWGHARVLQPPGFYYGRDGKPPAREVVAKGYGRIAIGHSELNGHQSATGAMDQGRRVARGVLGLA
jgi:spermidine dehydrogenase